MKSFIALLVSLFLATPVMAEEEVSMVSTKRLTLFTAVKIAQAAIAACTQKGIQIGVTVVDRDGNMQVFLRDTIAAPITLPMSRDKAYTAANFNAAGSELTSRAGTSIGSQPRMIMSAGSIPIQVGGSLVGAVGVSGAPTGELDEECAKAGVDAVLDDLEMAM